MNLYEINIDLQQMLLNAVDEDGVIIEGMEVGIDSLFKAKEDKLLNCAKYIKNEIAFIDMLKVEEKALSSRRKSIENRVKWMQSYILNNIEDGEKVSDSQASISTRKSSSVFISDQVLIPEEFLVCSPATYSPDKKAIKRALKDGEVLGAEIREKINLSIK